MPIKKTIPKTKIIGNEVYLLEYWDLDKKLAQEKAQKIRETNKNARVVKTTFGIWAVYSK